MNENWEKFNNAEEELDHDSNNQHRNEMEERYCYFTGFIETKIKQLKLVAVPELNVTTEPSVKVKRPQLSIPKFSVYLQDWVTFKDIFCH
jgi:hypothetical protein